MSCVPMVVPPRPARGERAAARLEGLAHMARRVVAACAAGMASLLVHAAEPIDPQHSEARLAQYEREAAARDWLISTTDEMLRRQQSRLSAAGLAAHFLAARLQAAQRQLDGLVHVLLAEEAAAATEAWLLPPERRVLALDALRVQTARRLTALAGPEGVPLCDLCMAQLTTVVDRSWKHLALGAELSVAIQAIPAGADAAVAEALRDQHVRAAALAHQSTRAWLAALTSAAQGGTDDGIGRIAAAAARHVLSHIDPAEIETLLAATTADAAQPTGTERAWQRLAQLAEASAELLRAPQFAELLTQERRLEELQSAYQRQALLGTMLDALAELTPAISQQRRRELLDRLVYEQAGIRQLLLRMEPLVAEGEDARGLAEAATAADACSQAMFAEQMAAARTLHTEARAALATLLAAWQARMEERLADVATDPPHAASAPRHAAAANAPDGLPPAAAKQAVPVAARPIPPGYVSRLRRYFSSLPPASP